MAAPLPVQPRPASEQLVYQQGVSPTAGYAGASDTFISRMGDEFSNYGSEPVLTLHSSDQRAVLLRFELEGLSPGDTVDRAILSLYVSDHPTGASALLVSLYRVLRPWAEIEATWYNATVSDLWTLAGCNSPASDRASSPSASSIITATGAWLDLDITSLVQAWVSAPATNRGVVLAAPGSSSVEYLLRSSEYANPSFRPKLVVTYTL